MISNDKQRFHPGQEMMIDQGDSVFPAIPVSDNGVSLDCRIVTDKFAFAGLILEGTQNESGTPAPGLYRGNVDK